jgi:DMSO/TMAO reductase YedYZ heme-binding membrane subunit
VPSKKLNYVPFDKAIVIVNGLIPAAILAWDLQFTNIVASREYVLHQTGLLAIIFLTLSLAVTPLRKLTGWNYLSHFRRSLGLFAFFYALAHFITYFIFNKGANFGEVIDDVVQRPFILLGMAALLLMIPLALTSTNGMIKLLGGKRWKRLHQLVYAIALIAGYHYYMFPKSDRTKPKILLAVIGVLLIYRLVDNYLPSFRKTRRPTTVAGN